MNCREGDVAYFCRTMPPADWTDQQSVLVRATYGHVVELLGLAWSYPIAVWHVRPMTVMVQEGSRLVGGTLTLACDAHLVPIAGLSRAALLEGYER